MVSPDTTPYVDLRVFDRSAQDIFQAALTNLLTYLPEWEPREGHTEVVLLEALALQVSEAVFAINRVPGAVVEVLLRLYNIPRDLGSPPAAELTFTVTDDTGHTIPAGTRVALVAGDSTVVLATDETVAVPGGDTVVTVMATGDTNTTAANGVAPGTTVELVDAVTAVETVALSSYVGGGADVEDDAAWFTRGIQRFSRLAETLVLPRHFVSAALERPEVSRAFAIDNYDPGAGGSPGDHAGHVTVAVYGDGAELTSGERTVIEGVFDATAQANLAVHVVSPTLTSVPVTTSVVGVPGYTEAGIQSAVTDALADYFSPESWGWSQTVYRNELIALISNVPGVERVTTLTVPAGDQALTGVAPLTQLGAVAVTVTGL